MVNITECVLSTNDGLVTAMNWCREQHFKNDNQGITLLLFSVFINMLCILFYIWYDDIKDYTKLPNEKLHIIFRTLWLAPMFLVAGFLIWFVISGK